jgi:hypothetical protein
MEAASRFVLTVRNEDSDPVDGLHFHFIIPSGEISVLTFGATGRGRVAANISTQLTEIGVGPKGITPPVRVRAGCHQNEGRAAGQRKE